jgi:membrane-bound lytic murein transglycosylase A
LPRIAPKAAGLILLLLALFACKPGPPPPDRLTLATAGFADLPGWQDDDVAAALAAFSETCARILSSKQPLSAPLGNGTAGTIGDWQPPCGALATLADKDAGSARRFFESWFRPWRAGNNGISEGLFTGYYEPELNGARNPGGDYVTPLRKRPPDLVMVELGLFRPAWRGERIAGRVVDGRLKPYESRAEIDKGALDRFRLTPSTRSFWRFKAQGGCGSRMGRPCASAMTGRTANLMCRSAGCSSSAASSPRTRPRCNRSALGSRRIPRRARRS